jgi:hypothetical protein
MIADMPPRADGFRAKKFVRLFIAAFAASIAAAACGTKSQTNVVSRSASATSAAWAADGRVIFPEEVGTGPVTTAIKTFDPKTRERGVLLTVIGQPTWFDSDSIDRVLIGGLGGEWTLLREDGAVLFVVTSLPGVSGAVAMPRISFNGTKVAFVTASAPADLDVFTAADGQKVSAFAAFEPSAQVRTLAWKPDGLSIFYVKGDPSGVLPDAILRVATDDSNARVTILQDPAVPFIDRLFVSADGAKLLFSGRDAASHSGVWTVPSVGGVSPVKIASPGGDRLSVRAAAGPSPDGVHFVLTAATAAGPRLTVEPIVPEAP